MKCENCDKKIHALLHHVCHCKLKLCTKCKCNHNCTYDYKAKNKKELEKKLVKVEAKKIKKI